MKKRTAGFNLASEGHRLEIVDRDGGQLEPRRIAALVRRLLQPWVARVAIEQPNGIVVHRLLDADSDETKALRALTQRQGSLDGFLVSKG